MKTWQEMANEEMRRLVAASDGLLNLSRAGAPADVTMQARDKVCGAVSDLNAMLKKDAEARAATEAEARKKAEAEAKAKAKAEAAKAKAETKPAG
jgi:membrane protein involved in colicin uptake